MKIRQNKVKGIKIIQHKFNNSLIRNRGNEPRKTIIVNRINKALKDINLLVLIDASNKALNTTIEFSPKKIKENSSPPYSTLNPDTSSDSPSDKSKGERLFSINKFINNKIKNTKVILKEKNNLLNL